MVTLCIPTTAEKEIVKKFKPQKMKLGRNVNIIPLNIKENIYYGT